MNFFNRFFASLRRAVSEAVSEKPSSVTRRPSHGTIDVAVPVSSAAVRTVRRTARQPSGADVGEIKLEARATVVPQSAPQTASSRPLDDPSTRVYCSGSESVEAFYARMSRDLIGLHGPLVKAEYISHYPVFEIRFHYRDGTMVPSGQRTGRFDINFLSLGYVGEGPRYSKAFLDAAGCNRTAKEIQAVEPGALIVPGDSKVARFADAMAAAGGGDGNHKLTVSSLGVVCAGVQRYTDLALSPDGGLLALVAADGGCSEIFVPILDA